MPYDPTKDPQPRAGPYSKTFGRTSRAVTPSDSADIEPYPKAVVCLAGGDLSVVPVENADGVTVDFTGVKVGFVPPFHVRRVMATGTTATVATVED